MFQNIKFTSGFIRNKFIDYFKDLRHDHYPSSSLVPNNDKSLMFVNSGMVQFKDVFMGTAKLPDSAKYNAAVTCQKCIRAGGKHNDFENVGYTPRHHTFFEMLGNFSFGSYGKEEAIRYAFLFLTKELLIPKERLCVTVYHSDNEAMKIWEQFLQKNRIIKISTDDNFWRMGDTGPCGPCTEIFYDHCYGEYSDDSYGMPGTQTQDIDRYVEIWNIVFMQYNQKIDGTQEELPNLCVDTGMGLERVTAVCQGVIDNYDTDIFYSIINKIKNITPNQEKFVYKIISDHLRSSAFLMADGIVPGSDGSGYVLRKIIRRALLYINQYITNKNNKCIMEELFLSMLDDTIYEELRTNKDTICKYYNIEQELFNKTLLKGMKYINNIIANGDGNISGSDAFMLYDTYGFPLEITKEIAKRNNSSVDLDGFEKEMLIQKSRSRKFSEYSGVYSYDGIAVAISKYRSSIKDTEFSGYDCLNNEIDFDNIDISSPYFCKLIAVFDSDGGFLREIVNNKDFFIILNKTPFYAESGGQVADKGFLIANYKDIGNIYFDVIDVQKIDGVFVHRVLCKNNNFYNIKFNYSLLDDISSNTEFIGKVDLMRRKKIACNHTATHLLHKAIKIVIGNHISQKGSFVDDFKLRFDFNCDKQLTNDEIFKISDIVNSIIREEHFVTTKNIKYEDAVSENATALFGEKYSENVRVVTVDKSNIYFSKELCGGTHVKNTKDIMSFVIKSEKSISSGIRRIEAITHYSAIDFLVNRSNILSNIGLILKLGSDAKNDEFVSGMNQIVEEKELFSKKYFNCSVKLIASEIIVQSVDTNSFIFMYKNFCNEDSKVILKAVNNVLDQHDNGFVFCTNSNNDKITFFVGVGDSVNKEFIDKNKKNILKMFLEVFNLNGGGKRILQGSLGRIIVEKDVLNFIKKI